MIRTPLRPLARILDAREKGESLEAIERENIRLRGEAVRDKVRSRAQGRLLILGAIFLGSFITVGARMGTLAASAPQEPQIATAGQTIVAGRADITDRKGRILATNLLTHSLYAQPRLMVDPERVALELGEIFPDLDVARRTKDLTGSRKFLWIKKKLSPEQMQAVHDHSRLEYSFSNLLPEIDAAFQRRYAPITPPDPCPLLIVSGLPRSGKSLMETLLASQANLLAGGETSAIYNAFLDVDRRGECWASLCTCEGRETGSDIDFLMEIGNANDDEKSGQIYPKFEP